MSAVQETSSPAKSPPQLRPARFDDYDQLERLKSAHSMQTQSADEWRALWLDNPLWPRLGTTWPIGWVLENARSQVVGSISNIPSLYTFRGRELLCANGRAWVVAGEYRGFAPWPMDEYYSQEGIDLFVNTTVSAIATPMAVAISTRVPLGDWQTIPYWVTGYHAFAAEAMRKLRLPLPGLLTYPAAAALRLRDALRAKSLPAPPAWALVAPADSFDARFDAFWQELLRQNPDKLLAHRDSRTLSWHFALPMRRRRLWIFTASRNGLLRAYCVLKRQDLRPGLKRIRLVDYQTLDPQDDLLAGLLQAALRRCTAENVHVLEHLGAGLPKMRSIDQFAPHRHKLPNWPFYYKAPDASLNADLANPDVWDPSSYDGDASFD